MIENTNKIGKVKERVLELEKIKLDKENGKLYCIPFQNYPKLAQSVPGIVPGMITMVTAGSGGPWYFECFDKNTGQSCAIGLPNLRSSGRF